jgi:prephenate dehydrogenase
LTAPQKKLLVVGLGLIGGSVLMAARDYAPEWERLGFDRDGGAMRAAAADEIITNVNGELAELAAEADLIVLAVPPLAFASVFKTLADVSPAGKLLTDVASVKAPVLEACRDKAPAWLGYFVPGHPIAGAERSGLTAAQQDLFTDRKFILTPHAEVCSAKVNQVRAFWDSLRCMTVELESGLHDYLLASTSHLPHVLAYVLIDSLMMHEHRDGLFEFAAGGLRDVSRTASSDPTMWHDVFFSNKERVLEALDVYQSRLQHFRKLLVENESDELYELLKQARDGRNAFIERYNP